MALIAAPAALPGQVMQKYTSLSLGASIALGLLALQQAASAQAADDKTMSVAACVPRAPGTAANELVFVNNGVFNPGVQNEQIICPLPRDSETLTVQGANGATLEVGFKTGNVAGKVACTVFLGSSADEGSGGALSSFALNPPSLPPNTIESLFFGDIFDGAGSDLTSSPGNVVCTITPKTTLAFLSFREFQDTDDDAL